MMPIVDGLADEFAGEVAVLKLNGGIPAQERLASTLGLRGHPSFAILSAEGLVTGRFYGPQPAGVLREAMVAAR